MKALINSATTYLTVDWSENGTIIIPGEVQTAFFGRATYSIHSGYLYQKDNNHGFAMITVENNHKAESIWAALSPADRIGGNIKNQVEQLTSFSTEHNIRNAADVTTLLK
jgi:hypothetical protein